ncbi:MAG: hypothetical protein JKY49_06665 [Cohaesibacteraceae bacterium]|nr:hypothetical protein [Cohaesibacteraceae bacterium]MBL4877046.1 hypothetical protein [Cohaesibacteraceae bacterium]
MLSPTDLTIMNKRTLLALISGKHLVFSKRDIAAARWTAATEDEEVARQKEHAAFDIYSRTTRTYSKNRKSFKKFLEAQVRYDKAQNYAESKCRTAEKYWDELQKIDGTFGYV